MAKAIEVYYPLLDHKEHVANIGIIPEKVEGEAIINTDMVLQVYFYVINHGEKSYMKFKDIIIELEKGISCIRLDDLQELNKDSKFKFEFEPLFDGEVFATGRCICQKKEL